MKNELTDKYLSELFQNDTLAAKPDAAIKSRLDYTFMLKESRSKIRQNSFAGMFSWIFSLKSIPFKAAMVSIVLLFSVFNFPQNSRISNTTTVDSTLIPAIPFNIDSVINSPLRGDTCFIPGV